MTYNNQALQNNTQSQPQNAVSTAQNPQVANDYQSQYYQTQGSQTQVPIDNSSGQMPSDAFGGNVPFSNIQSANGGVPANYAPGNPEAGAMQRDRAKEAMVQNEYKVEQQKQLELQAEQLRMIERKESPKSSYPHNQQSMQQTVNQNPRNPVVVPVQPPKPSGPKFFGYMISPQIANNFALIANQKGKGIPSKSRTWIYVLLDRMLKKQSKNSKNI